MNPEINCFHNNPDGPQHAKADNSSSFKTIPKHENIRVWATKGVDDINDKKNIVLPSHHFLTSANNTYAALTKDNNTNDNNSTNTDSNANTIANANANTSNEIINNTNMNTNTHTNTSNGPGCNTHTSTNICTNTNTNTNTYANTNTIT